MPIPIRVLSRKQIWGGGGGARFKDCVSRRDVPISKHFPVA